MDWKSKLQEWISSLIKWVTRRRHQSRQFLLTGGVIVVGTLGGGLTFGVDGSAGALNLRGMITTSDGLPLWALVVAFCVGIALVIAGACMSWTDWSTSRAHVSRSAVIVLELRGLVDTSDRPLLQSIPSRLPGQRLDALIDVRGDMEAGVIQRAFDEISGIRDLVQRLRGSREKNHVELVVAGVLQLPLLFYTGVLLDDEGRLTPLDWDRKVGRWRELDALDDGEAFSVSGMEQVPPDADEVVIAVSASYQTDSVAIAATFSDRPVVSLSLARPLPDTLWSEAKQAALSAQFLSISAQLGNQGTRRIALVLAAPSSLAIRMGRAYDRRNLPEIACFHYERGATPPYPWSVCIGPKNARLMTT